ncbi:hypothetical protein BDK51DRAFT_28548 [Blyttiomyces helicus]|uniref:Uncharacterized protein n=1 Tax=Blyttiomyces helicus TaxID=388810 RepID=A0A4P9WQ60_9FUNG|nr:hypothetical protein BDK51DRAFT_28548 [Blyttiomyces helicus]|eukprot:RKO94722.1 hypothetical protein BDK51DRAFT_28548 [Blyttiomyces helicus]
MASCWRWGSGSAWCLLGEACPLAWGVAGWWVSGWASGACLVGAGWGWGAAGAWRWVGWAIRRGVRQVVGVLPAAGAGSALGLQGVATVAWVVVVGADGGVLGVMSTKAHQDQDHMTHQTAGEGGGDRIGSRVNRTARWVILCGGLWLSLLGDGGRGGGSLGTGPGGSAWALRTLDLNHHGTALQRGEGASAWWGAGFHAGIGGNGPVSCHSSGVGAGGCSRVGVHGYRHARQVGGGAGSLCAVHVAFVGWRSGCPSAGGGNNPSGRWWWRRGTSLSLVRRKGVRVPRQLWESGGSVRGGVSVGRRRWTARPPIGARVLQL